jgi:NH3-dependent NAD+ synthetase
MTKIDASYDPTKVSGPQSAVNIYNATPTADLWGPNSEHEDERELGLSYDEIEWADRQNMRSVEGFGIITSNDDPVRHPFWHAYTSNQRRVIAKMHALEKVSRHKINSNLPVCKVRDVAGLVK